MPRLVPRRWLRWAAEFAGWLVLSLVVVVPNVASYLTLSPIDELQHIDSMMRGSQLEIVRSGEKVGEPALRAQSCRGIDAPGFVSPPCDAPALDPASFQEAGYNTAAVHPPTYYVVTGVLAKVGVKLGVVGDIVTAARLLGAAWLAVGLMLTAALCRSLGASRLAAIASTALLAATPVVVVSSTTVTPDATGLAAGAAVGLATVHALHGRASLSLLVLAGAAANAFKLTGILAVAACCLALVLHARPWRRSAWTPGSRRWIAAPASLAAGGLGFSLLWTRIASALALDVPPSPLSRFNVSRLDPNQVLANVTSMLPPTQNSYLQPELRTLYVTVLVSLLTFVVLGGLTAVALRSSGSPATDALGVATLALMALGGPLFVVLTFVLAGAYFPIPSRYGLVLLPLAVATLASVCSPRRTVGALLGVFAGLQLLALWQALAG